MHRALWLPWENITVHTRLKQHKVGKANHQILVGWFLFSFFSDFLKALLVLTIGEHDLPCHLEQTDLEKWLKGSVIVLNNCLQKLSLKTADLNESTRLVCHLNLGDNSGLDLLIYVNFHLAKFWYIPVLLFPHDEMTAYLSWGNTGEKGRTGKLTIVTKK